MPRTGGVPPHDELTSLPEESLINMINDTLRGTGEWRLIQVQIFRDELLRRSQERATKEMLAFTRQMRNFTIAILILTGLNVAAIVVQVLCG